MHEAGHVECKDDLEAYLAQQNNNKEKRDVGFRSHERMHKRNKKRSLEQHAAPTSPSSSLLEKRASRSSSYRVCLIAVDHSLDMTTRAITPSVIDTFGGYKSVALADFDDVSFSKMPTPFFFFQGSCSNIGPRARKQKKKKNPF